MSSTVEQVKARLSIVDVVGGYVKLEKAGVNYKACCPFHSEKSPSFFVSPGRESYHCFGCAKGGDIISFVEEIEGLDFIGALKMLAERAGVEMETRERTSPEEKNEKEEILAALRDAALIYQATLQKNKAAQEYLKGRALTENTVRHFEVGYAPDGWRVILEALKARGHKEDIMEKAGLVIRSPKGPLYDRFRNRVMFPLKDANGSIVGFSGRLLADADPNGDQASSPKYMNSPETTVFLKSRVLFGIEKAKMAIRKSDFAVLVEGQMDLVLSHQAGVTQAVGVSGTALTEEHLTIVKRLSPNLIMAFDADKAGVNASKRAIDMALDLGMQVRIARLPDGLDPADLVRQDPEEWKRRVDGARHVIDFFLDIGEKETDSNIRRRTVEESILPYVLMLRSPLDQGHFVGKIANFLGQSEQSVWDALGKTRPRPKGKPSTTQSPAPRVVARPPTPSKMIAEKIYGLLLWQKGESVPSIDLPDAFTRLKNVLGEEENSALAKELDPKKGELALAAEVAHTGTVHLAVAYNEMLGKLEEELLHEKFRAIMLLLREAEKKGDRESLTRHLADCQAITSRLTALKTKRYHP